MKKSSTKILVLCLCTVLSVSGAAATAFAMNQDSSPQKQPKMEAASTGDNNETSSKDEAVYVLAGADGSPKKIIVSDWIKNTLGMESIKDKTDMPDVENTNGDESFTVDGSGSRVWDVEGNDLYYQGSIEKELPVDLTVTYKLDGKTISSEDLIGKTGKVTIRFDYLNKQYETVNIDGQNKKIYVPFAMLTGILLDNDVFTNVEVSNGKLINDGSRTAVIGIALPGLQENLAISKEKFEIPDFVEITADVKDFKLGMTVTMASNELFSNLNTDSFASVSELSEAMGELTNAMDKLLDGSSQLYDGLYTLLDKSGELAEGVNQLAAGAAKLKAGAEDIDSGAAALQEGAIQLSEGLSKLAENNASLTGGAKQVFETLLSTANTQLSAAGLDVPTLTIQNYADILNKAISSLDKNAVYEQALEKVTAAVNAQRGYITERVTSAVKEEVTVQVTAAVKEQVKASVTQAVCNTVSEQVIQAVLHMDKASYDAAVAAGKIDNDTKNSIEAAINEKMQTKQILTQIQTKTEEQMASQSIKNTIASNVQMQMQSDSIKKTITDQTELQIQKAISENMASDEVQAQLAAAAEGAKSVIALKSSLDSYNAFYLGLQTYTAGVADAAKGAGELKLGLDHLKAGTSQIYGGSSELYDGILTLKNGTPALTDGVSQLCDGAMQLSGGLKEFNEQGIQKLVAAVDGDLKGLSARFRITRDVSRNYKSFAGISENMDGQVKFIYRTDSLN